ncbi:MAG: DMT family transporter [Pseudomonadota bacterium]
MQVSARYAYLATFIGVCGHASSEFFAVLSGISGPEVSVWRYVIGAAGLVVWALLIPSTRNLIAPLKDGGLYFIMLSLIGVSATYLAFHWALDFASVIQVATVVTTIPIFVGLSNLIINKQPFTTVKIITGTLAILGIVVMLTDGYLGELSGDSNSLFGVALAVFCAAFGSAYSVLVKPIITKHGALPTTAVSLAIGGVGLWIAVGIFWNIWVNPTTLFDRPGTEVTAGVNPGIWILVLALWNTTITQILWFGGLAAAPDITRASYLFFLKPVIAAVLAVFILSQPISALEALAIVLVTSCVFVELFWPRIAAVLGKQAA